MNEISDSSIYSVTHLNTLKKNLLWELRSFIGRKFMNRKPDFRGLNGRFLHLGCYDHIFEGWVNADFFFVRTRGNGKPDWKVDLRYPLNCDDNVWDGVFTEHTLEHLYPAHALSLLKEIRRTMRSGAWLRVSVPDLGKYVGYYNGDISDGEFKQWPTGCEAIRSLAQNWMHLSLWDCGLLKRFLEEAGFNNIRETGFMQGTDKRLLKDLPERKWESIYVEAQKP